MSPAVTAKLDEASRLYGAPLGLDYTESDELWDVLGPDGVLCTRIGPSLGRCCPGTPCDAMATAPTAEKALDMVIACLRSRKSV